MRSDKNHSALEKTGNNKGESEDAQDGEMMPQGL